MYRWILLPLAMACSTATPTVAPTDTPKVDEPAAEEAAVPDTPPAAEDGMPTIDLETVSGELPPELDPANNLPVPFTAAQLAGGFTLGTTLSYELSGTKTPAMTVGWKVVGHTSESVEIEFTPKVKEGEDPPVNKESFTFGMLEQHAMFPKALATRKEMSFTVKAGTFDVWFYEVRPPGGNSVERYYFAKRLPGPPVLHSVMVDGEEVHRMEMLTHSKI